jgi:hypothetical protein
VMFEAARFLKAEHALLLLDGCPVGLNNFCLFHSCAFGDARKHRFLLEHSQYAKHAIRTPTSISVLSVLV